MANKTVEMFSEQFDRFCEARGWRQTPEDLAKSIVIEAAELLEHFQWDTSTQSLGVRAVDKDWKEIGQEVADVFLYLVRFCSVAGIDLPEAVERKMEHNETKYPKEKFENGHNDKFYKEQKKKYRQS